MHIVAHHGNKTAIGLESRRVVHMIEIAGKVRADKIGGYYVVLAWDFSFSEPIEGLMVVVIDQDRHADIINIIRIFNAGIYEPRHFPDFYTHVSREH